MHAYASLADALRLKTGVLALKFVILTAGAVVVGAAYLAVSEQPPLAFLAGPQCPTADDLGSGITFVDENGALLTYTTTAPDIIARHVMFQSGGSGTREVMAYGTYSLDFTTVDADGIAYPAQAVNWEYPIDIADIPVPEAATDWAVDVVVDYGHRTKSEAWTMVWGDLETILYGDCTYDMIAGDFLAKSDDSLEQNVIHYLPELGFGVIYSRYRHIDTEPNIFPRLVAIQIAES